MAGLTYPVAATVTLAAELPVYAAVLRARAGTPIRWALAGGAAVNVVTHPLLWFVLVPGLRAVTGSHLAAVVLAETAAWFAEGAMMAWGLGRRPGAGDLWSAAMTAAIAANATSFLLGVLIESALP